MREECLYAIGSNGAGLEVQMDALRQHVRRTKAAIRTSHQRFVLKRAFSEFKKDPIASLNASDLFARLRYGWGNEGWSAPEGYLRDCVREAIFCNESILECGSGLTTILIGVVAEQYGREFVSLEHSELWIQQEMTWRRR